METKDKQLPENTVVKIAENANIQIHNNKRNINVPLYVDRTAEVMNPKGFLTFHIPESVTEMEVTIEIPLKDNLTDKNVSLVDAMSLMKTARGQLREVYGIDAKIEDHIICGNQIKITGTYSVGR